MGKKDTDLIHESNKALAMISSAMQDLGDEIKNAIEEKTDELNELKLKKEQLLEEIDNYEISLKGYKNEVKHYSMREAELVRKEKRIKVTEKLIDEEKKLIASKKQHLLEWESELAEKARRLNG